MALLFLASGTTLVTPPPDLVRDRGLSRLLTQRAVQQTIHFLRLNKDEVIARWLSQFMVDREGSGISPDFHGIDALPSPSSSQYVCGLLALEPTMIQVRRRAMPQGGSADNPYLKREAFSEVAMEVEGAKLGGKVMAMRESLAAEWVQDCALFKTEDESLLARHVQAMSAGAYGSSEYSAAAAAAIAGTMPAFDVGRLGGEDGRSSPFRLATYDLLKLLATREAILSVLDELAGGDGRFGAGHRARPCRPKCGRRP